MYCCPMAHNCPMAYGAQMMPSQVMPMGTTPAPIMPSQPTPGSMLRYDDNIIYKHHPAYEHLCPNYHCPHHHCPHHICFHIHLQSSYWHSEIL